MSLSFAASVAIVEGVIIVVLLRDLINLTRYTNETCAILKKCRDVLQNTSGTEALKAEVDEILDTGDKVMARDTH